MFEDIPLNDIATDTDSGATVRLVGDGVSVNNADGDNVVLAEVEDGIVVVWAFTNPIDPSDGKVIARIAAATRRPA